MCYSSLDWFFSSILFLIVYLLCPYVDYCVILCNPNTHTHISHVKRSIKMAWNTTLIGFCLFACVYYSNRLVQLSKHEWWKQEHWWSAINQMTGDQTSSDRLYHRKQSTNRMLTSCLTRSIASVMICKSHKNLIKIVYRHLIEFESQTKKKLKPSMKLK